MRSSWKLNYKRNTITHITWIMNDIILHEYTPLFHFTVFGNLENEHDICIPWKYIFLNATFEHITQFNWYN